MKPKTVIILILLIMPCLSIVVQTGNSSSTGTFTDPRDGQTYRTVKIGNLTWMAENLNFQTDDSWCYDNADSNCVKFGRLYTWNTAVKACPAGWRLPDTADWNNLIQTAGGDITGMKLKSKIGWDDYSRYYIPGTDEFGFSALPGGDRSTGGRFRGVGTEGYWWTATEGGYGAGVQFMDSHSVGEGTSIKNSSFSVRCARD